MRFKSSPKLNIFFIEILVSDGDRAQLSVHWKGEESHLKTFGLHNQCFVEHNLSGVNWFGEGEDFVSH